MTAGEAALIITAVAPIVVAVIGGGVSVATFILTRRNGVAIQQIHQATNGMKTELVAAVQKAAESKGRDDERRNPSV